MLKHRMYESPEYAAWSHMKARCLNPTNPNYYRYGKRGITVHPEWVTSFETFFAHIGPRPGKGWSLERIKNDRGYEPGNVKWATAREQANNRRGNVLLTAHGKTQTLAQWAREVGLEPELIGLRMKRYGWTIEEALQPRVEPTITFKGKTQTVAEWARELGIGYPRLWHRLKSGWPLERAMNPARSRRAYSQPPESAE